jgi:cysteinyl-tRNA synthetase
VLWKAAKPEDEAVGAAWDAPFGRGRPGWHLECSAMALDLVAKELGADVLDIHAGGVDLIFPHHEDEIAQSCAFTGQEEFARVWMHGEFLTMAGTKMSKRFGNILTARDLREEGVDAGAVRLLLFQSHYRQKLDFSDQALEAAREGVRRLGDFDRRLGGATAAADDPALLVAAETFHATFTAAMNDDLNAPQALAAVFTFVREGNRLLDQGAIPGPEVMDAWGLVAKVLDVLPSAEYGGALEIGAIHTPGEVEWGETPPADATELESWARYWAGKRVGAKGAKAYAEADRIRDLLSANGFEVRDRKDGVVEVVRK